MTIPNNVILIHLGSNASIPTGWVRETGLDGKFPKGWGDSVAPNQIGGATTHTHTSPTHTHTVGAHTHTYTLSNVGDQYGQGKRGENNYREDVEHDHYHNSSTSGAVTAANSGTTEVTYSAVSNNPPNRKVIFIKSNGGKLETNMAALWIESDDAPTNWSKVTELADRYLLGASTGEDADLTTDGGSTSNSHTYNHSHTTAAHSHAGGTSVRSKNYPSDGRRNGGAGACVSLSHTHSPTWANSNQNVTDYSGSPSAQSETVEPAYQRLHAIKKDAAGIKEKGIIGMWLGSSTAIPMGWTLVTEMKDKHLKIGNPISSGTGGSNTHTHAAQGHTHTGSGTHTHTATCDAHTNGQNYNAGAQNEGVMVQGYDVHLVQSISSTTANFDSTNITADSSSNEPEYRTVAFIKFKEEIGGSLAFLFDQLI